MASEKPSGADRRNGLRALAASLPAIAGKALGRRGFAEAGIITDWPAIVGPTLAAQSLPLKLSFPRGQRSDGVLLVRVSGPLAIELQHLAPQVLERVNTYLGYRAVGQIKLRQGVLPAAAVAEREPPALPEAALAELRRQTAGIADDDLRQALEGLGRALRTPSRRRWT
jgi:hypothetical protein